MKIRLLFVILIVCISNVAISQSKKATLTEKEKIEALIKSVENLKNAKFYRNGSFYDSESAGKHLRMKVSKAGNKVKTVQDFIDKIASESSVTGEKYKIVFADGKELTTRTYFYNILKTLE